jgi:hypothetical protein
LQKGLYISSDFVKSSAGLSATRWYYKASRVLAEILSAMFRTLMPDAYKKYRVAFDAGVWEKEDPGPWLGRAIVYKLPVNMHTDGKDEGPTASFPVGSYTGGEMLVPDLRAKFQ